MLNLYRHGILRSTEQTCADANKANETSVEVVFWEKTKRCYRITKETAARAWIKRFHRCDLWQNKHDNKKASRDTELVERQCSESDRSSGLYLSSCLGPRLSTPFQHIMFPCRWLFRENKFPAVWSRINSKGQGQTEAWMETWDLLLHIRWSQYKRTLNVFLFFFINEEKIADVYFRIIIVIFTLLFILLAFYINVSI